MILLDATTFLASSQDHSRRCSQGCRRDRISRIRLSRSKTTTRSIGIGTFIHFAAPRLSPDSKVFDVDSVTWRSIGTDDINGASSYTVRTRSLPICEVQILIVNAIPRLQFQLGPVAVNVEAIRVFVPDEIAKGALFNGSRSSVGLYHEHLVRVDCIDIVIMDMMDI